MKKNIAVIFGGRSVEHDVSIITAHVPIIKSLQAIGEYDVWPVYISKDGNWYCDQVMNDFDFFKVGDFENRIKGLKKINISFADGLKIIWPGWRPKTLKIDLAFPAMHGTYGEDGSLMGLLRLARIPFVGSDLFASAVAMDKVLTKQVLGAEGLPVVPYIWFTAHDWQNDKPSLREKILGLNWPIYIKPVHLGSSIAISRIENEKDLDNAIEVALHYDNKILVEESVNNLIEVTLPIIGNDDLKLGGVERPLKNNNFFDFEGKYLSGGKKSSGLNNVYSEIPAKIDTDLLHEVERLGRETYRTIGCTGISRVDFLIDEKVKKVYINEVNTLPGSLYDHNWRKVGLSSIDLIKKLIVLAEEKFKNEDNITHTFKSEILKGVTGTKLK